MPKKACCNCVAKKSCCNSILYENFITLYGNTMMTSAPVNPQDILILRMNRPGNQSSPAWIYHPDAFGNACIPCCG